MGRLNLGSPQERLLAPSSLLPTDLPRLALGAVAAAGFVSALGQILLLRELLVLFYGNELSTGIVLTAWLLWTAAGSYVGARLSTRFHNLPVLLPIGLWVQASLLPAAVLFIRASRTLWSIPLGEMFPFGVMLAITVAATSFFCATGGMLFALAWGLACSDLGGDRGRPLGVYVGEALGSAVGGLTAHYLFVPLLDGCEAAFAVAAILSLVGALLLPRKSTGSKPLLAHLGLAGGVLAAGWLAIPLVGQLAFASHRWHWGDHLIAVDNTPYHHLALLKDHDQFSLFGNGLWFFSVPDPQTAELAVHPALLQHREPRAVLLLGGGVGGQVQEVLKHPTIERIDMVEPDPGVLQLLRRHEAMPVSDWISDRRVRILTLDGGTHVRHARERYDVILLNVGEPINADMNRFHTLEFYRRLRERMEPGAILTLSLPSAPDVVGEAQLRYLAGVHATLRAVFPDVLALPGDSVRLLAGSAAGSLSADPNLLSSRIEERRLDLQFVQDFLIQDLMSPLRLDYLRSILGAQTVPPINRDFTPTCYFNALLVWSSQLHPAVERSLSLLAESFAQSSVAALSPVALSLLLLVLWGWGNEQRSIKLAVALAGGSLMVVEIVLLLAFQILEGFLYSELVVILSCFMTGMAAGAAVVGSQLGRVRSAAKCLIAAHCLLVLLVFCVMLSLFTLHRLSSSVDVPSWLSLVLFRGLALTAGSLGGAHFSLATAAWARGQSLAARIGAVLYAADLVGAALGALLSSFLLLPLLGVHATLILVAFLLICGGVLLFMRLGWR
jgi:spermidine synthase